MAFIDVSKHCVYTLTLFSTSAVIGLLVNSVPVLSVRTALDELGVRLSFPKFVHVFVSNGGLISVLQDSLFDYG